MSPQKILLRNRTLIISFLFLLTHSLLSAACSLNFTSPQSGATVFSLAISVTGTGAGAGNANQGDVGQVTATVNGTIFFQQTGVFSRLIDFLGSGAASVTLQPSANTLVVSGSVSGCSASDSVVVIYDPNPVKTKKNLEPQNTCNGTNPINGSTGNKYQQEMDYQGYSLFPLVFQRYYNSSDTHKGILGNKWRHNYSSYLNITSNSLITERPSGQGYRFQHQNNQWLPDADINFRLEPQSDGSWVLLRDDDAIERYDSQGRLMSIQLRDGLIQVLTYDNEGRWEITEITGSYMVRPVLQVKFVRNIKKYCIHISGLEVRSFIYLWP